MRGIVRRWEASTSSSTLKCFSVSVTNLLIVAAVYFVLEYTSDRFRVVILPVVFWIVALGLAVVSPLLIVRFFAGSVLAL